jgi:hypothetical protein
MVHIGLSKQLSIATQEIPVPRTVPRETVLLERIKNAWLMIQDERNFISFVLHHCRHK